jgi:hypothetical protein
MVKANTASLRSYNLIRDYMMGFGLTVPADLVCSCLPLAEELPFALNIT